MFRIKDGGLVSISYTSGTSTLELPSVTSTDTGSYSCRASNDYNAIASSSATVVVRGWIHSYSRTQCTQQSINCLSLLAKWHYLPVNIKKVFLCPLTHFLECIHIAISESSGAFCSVSPSPTTVTLPTGCLFNGESSFDPGQCQALPCHTGEDNSDTCTSHTRLVYTIDGRS